jgi:hypothetical protein
VSAAHSDAEIDQIIATFRTAVAGRGN